MILSRCHNSDLDAKNMFSGIGNENLPSNRALSYCTIYSLLFVLRTGLNSQEGYASILAWPPPLPLLIAYNKRDH